MADKLTSKFKNLLKGDRSKADEQQREREELRKWYGTSSFTLLDQRGQEAFFKFLWGRKKYTYEMNQRITDVPVDDPEMEGDARRYQFWIKCENMELEALFNVYVVDEKTKIKDASDTFRDRELMKTKAGSVDGYVKALKERMKPDLDEQFAKFKTRLAEYERDLTS